MIPPQDPRFNKDIDQQTGYRTRSLLCMPIKDPAGEVLGVAQAVNKVYPQESPFSQHDLHTFQSYVAFCGVGLRNARLYRESQLETRRNQVRRKAKEQRYKSKRQKSRKTRNKDALLTVTGRKRLSRIARSIHSFVVLRFLSVLVHKNQSITFGWQIVQ